mgnify:CR=1 FL=1
MLKFNELVNFKPSEFQQRAFARKDPRENQTKQQKMRSKLAGAALDRRLKVKKPVLKSFKEREAERKRSQNEEAPANATGAAVVGTGDNQVHWKKKRRFKLFQR